MADERNTENFALGLIVAAIIFLLLRRELTGKGTSRSTAATQPNAVSSGCGGCGSSQASQIAAAGGSHPGTASNVIPIGGQSYSNAPFSSSSVTPGAGPNGMLEPFETSPGHVQWEAV